MHEGLVTKSRGRRTRVRVQPKRRVVELGAGDEVDARMPTEAERRRLGIPVGEPALEVRRADGRIELHAGGSITLRVPGSVA